MALATVVARGAATQQIMVAMAVALLHLKPLTQENHLARLIFHLPEIVQAATHLEGKPLLQARLQARLPEQEMEQVELKQKVEVPQTDHKEQPTIREHPLKLRRLRATKLKAKDPRNRNKKASLKRAFLAQIVGF